MGGGGCIEERDTDGGEFSKKTYTSKAIYILVYAFAKA